MYCPGSNTETELKDQWRIEHYVFAILSPALNCHFPARWAMAAVCAFLKLHKSPQKQLVHFLYFLSHWQCFVEGESMQSSKLFHICFSFSAAESLNKQEVAVATCIKSSKEERWVTPEAVLVWRNKQLKQFAYTFFLFCKAIFFLLLFFSLCCWHASLDSVSFHWLQSHSFLVMSIWLMRHRITVSGNVDK